MSWLCAQKLARLQAIVAERTAWAEPLAQVKRLHGWLLEVEHLLDGSLAAQGEVLSNVTVGSRLDRWREHMSRQLTDGALSQLEQECLREFLQVLANLRSHLVQCYDRQDFPRTNNDMERSMRGLKTQYRRVSGRKNWNAYLLRYGRCVAYAAWWEQDAAHRKLLEQSACTLAPTATGDHPRSERATHALSFSSQAPGFARFPRRALGHSCSVGIFALTVFFASSQVF